MTQATGENAADQMGAMQRPFINGGQIPAAQSDQREVQAAVAADRARIAREMDDTVGKSLLGISMIAASLASAPRADRTHALDQQLRALTRLARRAVSDTRCVINDLREEALVGEVRSIATAWGVFTGVNVSLELASESTASAQSQCELLADLREALRNVERHARADQVRIGLRRAGERLLLTVADDGIGFRPPADLAELEDLGCAGLNGMNERARRLGGQVSIESWPGRGTRLQVEIHAPAPARRQFPAGPTAAQARVIIADSNPVLRVGLRAALEQAADIEITAEAGHGQEVAPLVREHHPDVLLLDARMPLPDGLATIGHLSRLTRIVMLTCVDDADLAMGAIAAGASGCLLRGEFEPGELIQAVLEAARQQAAPKPHPRANGTSSLRPGLSRPVPSPRSLRPREMEIMGLIAEGLSNRQIAARLVITEKTVKNHICSIYQRFGVAERSQAVSRWREYWSSSDLPGGPSW